MEAISGNKNKRKGFVLVGRLEYFLIKVIVYCDSNNIEATRKFKHIKLSQKIDWAKKDLEKHYSDIYKNVEEHLNDLSDLLPTRNYIAHCAMDFDENKIDKSFFIIKDIEFVNGENKFALITYTMDQFEDFLLKLKEKVITLLALWKFLVEDYKSKNAHQ